MKKLIFIRFVYGGELGRLLNRTEWHWYQLAGASYQYTVDEVSKLCEEYIYRYLQVLKIQNVILKNL